MAAIKTFDLVASIQPTEGDMLAAVMWLQSRILQLTAQGLDYQGFPFHAYSRRGPYYYYPGGKANRAAAFRLRSKAKTKYGTPVTAGIETTPGGGLRFPSYASFKLDFLGRSTVDLTGPSAPHMLQQIQPSARGNQAALGIYGDAADRATGHNEGTKTLPQRRFFDCSDESLDQMMELVMDRIAQRWNQAA